MPVHGYDKMSIEYRIWIDKDIVFLAFAAVKFQAYLVFRPVFPAKEALPDADGGRIHFGGSRDYPCRIVLQFHIQSSRPDCPYLRILQCPVIVSGQRPA